MDVRTVAGRLGHSGGGTTTLRTYAAWMSEADQRAASGIGTRMPSRPAPLAATERAQRDPQSPYEKIAAELRHSILSGVLADGDLAPTEKQLAADHHVAMGTAHRAMELLKTWGFITSSRGRRAIVVRPSSEPLPAPTAESDSAALVGAVDEHPVSDAAKLWAITLRGPDGRRYPARHVCGDLNRPDSFRAHLLAIARIEEPRQTNGSDGWIGGYELEVREFGKEYAEPMLTLRWQAP